MRIKSAVIAGNDCDMTLLQERRGETHRVADLHSTRARFEISADVPEPAPNRLAVSKSQSQLYRSTMVYFVINVTPENELRQRHHAAVSQVVSTF